jgi:hypothetical protein
VISVDGEVIQDNRGRFWFKHDGTVWNRGQIQRLTDELPEGAVWLEDMSAEDLAKYHDDAEKMRILRLCAADCDREFKEACEKSMKKSIELRARLEIQGESPESAMNTARRFYTDEVDRLSAKYRR